MKTITGTVISNKMKKTVVIERVIKYTHPLYKKILKREKHLKARTDIELALGDKVTIISTRPISKDVHYKVVEKLA